MIYWLIWPVGITVWLTIGWVAFAYFEWKGLGHDHAAGYITLSYFVYRVTKAWPPAIFLMGLGVGGFWVGLAVHFWWHWCPDGLSVGEISLPAIQMLFGG